MGTIIFIIMAVVFGLTLSPSGLGDVASFFKIRLDDTDDKSITISILAEG